MTYRSVAELDPAVALAAGVIELGEYDHHAVFDAVRWQQRPEGSEDNSYKMSQWIRFNGNPEAADQLMDFVRLGAEVLGEYPSKVTARLRDDISPLGGEYGPFWHTDNGNFSMSVADEVGTVLLIDPDNPARLLQPRARLHELVDLDNIGPEFQFQTRPGVVTLMHRDLFHKKDPSMSKDRKLLRVCYEDGVWPS